jgi:hypothetical protein
MTLHATRKRRRLEDLLARAQVPRAELLSRLTARTRPAGRRVKEANQDEERQATKDSLTESIPNL